jgi:hypothetical protein
MYGLFLADSQAEAEVRRYAASIHRPVEERRGDRSSLRQAVDKIRPGSRVSCGRSSSLGRCGSLNVIVAQPTVIDPCIQGWIAQR